ncbi:MAG: tRNA pseudouridine(38-40) synthase TruA [Parvularculaceae bacterium]|nr:tRNA pseudouridine(38-40) synthase TruA [Parvularculaceae bacterium]
MARYKLIIEYDGGPFVGWQFQENGPSVQGALEQAALRFCGESVTAHSAGRTDAGVHALGMVAHIDIEKKTDAFRLREALNFHLKPAPIAVLSAMETDDAFHARFSASRRHYRYRIINRRAPLTIDAGRAWRLSPPIDADAMNEAAQILIGKHDFTTFRASTCQAQTPVKTLSAIKVRRTGDEVCIETSARSFLHHQVRSIAGSLVEVGFGRWSAADFKSAFEARDRSRCAQVAPAEGLYFLKADYD